MVAHFTVVLHLIMAPHKKAQKLYLDLNKKEICAAASFFYSECLDDKLLKPDLQVRLKYLMDQSAHCVACGNGQCDPNTHIFSVLEPPFVSSDNPDPEDDDDDESGPPGSGPRSG